ncbi:MAG: maleylacetoacetate isomerase [Acidobacteriota bacterium]|nr:maleylacetoacetate isomerase [Acidobacteriota bacterium]
MADFVLYSYWRSSCSYRVRIALELKEQAYEYRGVHLVRDGGEQHRSDYRQLNPMGQVPYLIHKNVGLAQSMAAIEYLDAVHPQPRLIPTDPVDGARVRQLCEMINTGIQPLQNLGVLQYLGRHHDLDGEGKAGWSRHWMELGFSAFERELETHAGKFCFGDTPTAADCFLIPQVYNARRFKLDLGAFPHITRITETCEAMPAFKRAEPSVQPDAQA